MLCMEFSKNKSAKMSAVSNGTTKITHMFEVQTPNSQTGLYGL